MKFINEEWLSIKIFPAAPTMVVPYEETYEETAERFTLIWTIKDISIWLMYEAFTRQPYKIATHTHSNYPLAKADELLECIWPFCGVGA